MTPTQAPCDSDPSVDSLPSMDPLIDTITAPTIATIDHHLATLGLVPRTADVLDVEILSSVAAPPASVVWSAPRNAPPPASVVASVASVAPPPETVVSSTPRIAPFITSIVPSVPRATLTPAPVVSSGRRVAPPPTHLLSNGAENI